MRTTALQILQAHQQQGDGSQPQLAQRFRVSVSHLQKIHRQWRRSGKMEPIPHHPGRKPKFSEAIRQQLRGWLQQRPDLTRAELQEKLRQQAQLGVSQPSAVGGAAKDGIALKKSHCMRKNVTPRQTGSGVRGARKSLPGELSAVNRNYGDVFSQAAAAAARGCSFASKA